MNGLSVAQGLRNPVDLRFQVHEAAHGDLCGSWDSWESGEQHSWNVFFFAWQMVIPRNSIKIACYHGNLDQNE